MKTPSKSHTRRTMKAYLTGFTLQVSAFIFCVLFAAAPALHAATEDWTGVTTGTWALSTNWSGNFTPDSTSDLTILGPGNAVGALTINLDAAAAANSINFTNTAATILQGSGANRTLTLSSSGTAITTGSGAVTIGTGTGSTRVNIALGANQTWDIGSGNMTAKDAISGGFSLTKNGTGTLTLDSTLNGANTYTGGTIVNAGTLTVASKSQYTDGSGQIRGALTINSGATVIANSWSLGYGVSGSVYGAAGNSVTSITINGGTLNMAQGFGTVASNITMTGGSITGTTNTGTGWIAGTTRNATLQTLAASTTATISSSVPLRLSSTGSLTFDVASGSTSNGVDLLVSGAIVNATAGNAGENGGRIVKTGNGTMVLSGNNTYNGTTTISQGTMQFAKSASLYNGTESSWTAANIKVASGATLALNVGGTNEFSTGNVTTLLTNLGGANGTSTNGFAAGSKIAFDTTNAAGGNFTVGDIIADSTGSGGGAIGVTKVGTGTLTLSGNNTYTGATLVSAGTLVVSGTGSIQSSATTVSSSATLNVNAGGIAGSVLANSGGFAIINGTAGDININGGSLSGNATAGNVTVQNGGTLNPGNSPGIQNFSSLTLTGNTTTTTMEIVGANTGNGTAGSTFDQIITTGNIAFGGVLALTFTVELDNNITLSLFNAGGTMSGSFFNVTGSGFAAYNGSWSQSGSLWTKSTGTQLLTFSELTGDLNVIPEPSTWALLAFSLTTVVVFRRRHRRSA